MLIIFDWDGTLVDSAGKIVAAMNEAAVDTGLAQLEPKAIRSIIGLGLPEAIATLYPGIDAETVDNMRQAYSHRFINSDHGLSPLFPGVEETLEALIGAGATLAVATGKSRRGLNRELGAREMEHYFPHTRCADETASKPDPLMLHQLLDEAGRGVEEAVMVGDTLFDMEMAANANMRRVAVSYGAHERDVLEDHGPDLLIDDFSTILNWVEGGIS